MANGIFTNNDLVANIPFIRMTGRGSVNLADATVDYRLNARVLERPEFAEGSSDAELDEFTEAVIPLRITGPLDSPSVVPDIEDMLKQELEDEIKRQITDKLLGGSSKDKEAGAEGAADGEPEKEEDLEDLAKRALFDLLKN